jgi:vesicle coat complex subunit
VLLEFKEYATEVDVEFVRKAVRAIGYCAISIQSAAERCINVLLELIQTKVNYVVQESVIVIKDIFRRGGGGAGHPRDAGMTAFAWCVVLCLPPHVPVGEVATRTSSWQRWRGRRWQAPSQGGPAAAQATRAPALAPPPCRRYPNRYESIIGTLCDSLESLDEPEAKASMVWIIGEYAERIDNAGGWAPLVC